MSPESMSRHRPLRHPDRRRRGSSSSRSCTRSSVASRATASSSATRLADPEPVGPVQLHGRPVRGADARAVLEGVLQQLVVAAIAVSRDGRPGISRRHSSSRGSCSAAARPSTRCSRWACCSRRPSRSCRSYILVRELGLTEPARRGPAAGRLRAAADDHHPAAVLQEHPRGARGRGQDRRLQQPSASSGGSAAPGATGARHGQRPGHRQHLERVPAPADRPPGAEQWTLPLGVMNFSGQYMSDQARILAYTVDGPHAGVIFYSSPSASSSAA